MIAEITTIVIPLILLLGTILSYFTRYDGKTKVSLTLIYLIVVCWSIYVTYLVYTGNVIVAFGEEFRVDSLSALYLILVSSIFMMCLLYSYDYMEQYVENFGLNKATLKSYYSMLTITFLTLYVMSISNNAFILWVFVEATTLTTVLLVGYGRSENSLEASWKYILLCVVGLTSALYGTSLIYSYIFNVTGDPYKGLLFTSIGKYISSVEYETSTFALLMIVIGYGVKAGIVPVHWWLPDAYSEAPSPISAVLSSVVTGCGFYAIFRWFTILSPPIYDSFKPVFLAIGIASIFIGSLSIIGQTDLKRALAYSSITNMGVIALAMAYPPLGIAYAIMHLFNHSLLKATTFLATGNLEHVYGRRNSLHGVIADSPVLGFTAIASVIALEGSPPFSMFYSVLGVALAIGDIAITLIYLIGLFIGFIALTYMFIETIWGEKVNRNMKNKCPRLMVLTPLLLLTLTAILGLYISPLANMCWRCVPR